MNSIEQLNKTGQSLWYDNIQRKLLENGELAKMITDGDIRGVTSNPSIFHNAIAKSQDYDPALNTMAWAGGSADQIYDRLTIEDIQAAADLFLPLYRESNGGDGYVSLEVNPLLAHDSARTASEAKRLWKEVNRPNLMIKIPATKEGLPAVTQVIASGINVNVTLIFSLERYQEVIAAYLNGLKNRSDAGQPVDRIASVASFFISRVDTKVDAALQKKIAEGGKTASAAKKLLGKAAIANARLAYEIFEKEFSSPEFKALEKKGAWIQRPLWASTSTKNPAYRDVIYIEDLIGKNTVNTVPPQTLKAFKDHGITKETIRNEMDACHALTADLAALGISMAQVTQELEDEGVKAFADAFVAMMATIEERRVAAALVPGSFQKRIQASIERLAEDKTIDRLYANDPTLWTTDPAGQEIIRGRLGWLNLPEKSRKQIDDLRFFAKEIQDSGFQHVLLLGMGGSSLAPEVMSNILGSKTGMDLSILDSTDPGQVLSMIRRAPCKDTLFIVSSKSGGTAEVNAFLDTFWSRCINSIGDEAGKHFVAITDPGTSLEKLAKERKFRRIFLADPTVGGRYSALTLFGLVPAALLGVDLNQVLDIAERMEKQCSPDVPAGRNPGLVLGAVMGQAAVMGMDKITIVADPEVAPFGAWLEQLVAESSGKQGKGILPVNMEPCVRISKYGDDRVFFYLRMNGKFDQKMAQLKDAGHPVLTYSMNTGEEIFGEFYRWGVATSVACSILKVNAFDQPDVQDNKNRTVEKVNLFKKTNKLDEPEPIWKSDNITVYGDPAVGIKKAKNIKEVLLAFIRSSVEGDYIAINAYIPRNRTNQARLQKIRKWVLESSSRATTLGYGPRFLHSTGQLHKGGAGNGLYIQITADPVNDLDIPGEGISFGILERAQSLGDYEALEARGRRLIRIHLDSGDLEELSEALG
jgi:transaldolase/glucose-6-phosphate isomerase